MTDGHGRAGREEVRRAGGSRPSPAAPANGSLLRWLWEWSKTLALALVIFVVVRSLLVEAFQIPTRSMENTLLVGDFLLVNKAVYGAEVPGTGWELPALQEPDVGDVVVFRPPPGAGQEPGARYVKRIVGGPGDTVSMKGGALYRNGEPVAEPYAKHVRPREDLRSRQFRWQRSYLVREGRRHRPYRPTRDNWGPVAVPDDRYFVMGDNRDDSEDSRYWGFVARDAIEGRPMVVYYSYRRGDGSALSWLTEIRWDRFFTPVE